MRLQSARYSGLGERVAARLEHRPCRAHHAIRIGAAISAANAILARVSGTKGSWPWTLLRPAAMPCQDAAVVADADTLEALELLDVVGRGTMDGERALVAQRCQYCQNG